MSDVVRDTRPARWERWALISLVLVAALVYAADALGRHARFATSGFDLGIYGQAVWHWSRFEAAESTIRRVQNLFGDHFHPTLMLYAPAFWFGDGLRNLLVAQVLVVTSAAFPIHAFARRRLGAWPTLGITGAYLSSWGVAQGLAFDVHDTSWSALALALTLDAFDRRSGWRLVLAAVFLLLTREDQGLALMGLGVAAFFLRRPREGALAVAAGLGWVLLATRVIIPYFGGAPYLYWFYGYLGPDLPSALIGAITHPLLVARNVFLPLAKTKTLLKGLGTYAFLPLFSPLSLVCAPNVLALLLSDSEARWESRYHYWMPISATAAIAAADGLARLGARRKTSAHRLLPALAACLVLLSAGIASRTPELGQGVFGRAASDVESGRRILSLVPPEASVSATNQALGHLAARRSAYLLRYGGFSAQGFLPVRAEYVVVDAAALQAAGGRRAVHPFTDPDYEEIAAENGWSLHRLRPGIPVAQGLQPITLPELKNPDQRAAVPVAR